MQTHKLDAAKIFELEEPWKSRFLDFAARWKGKEKDKLDLDRMAAWFEKDTAFHKVIMALFNAWSGYRRQVDKRKKGA